MRAFAASEHHQTCPTSARGRSSPLTRCKPSLPAPFSGDSWHVRIRSNAARSRTRGSGTEWRRRRGSAGPSRRRPHCDPPGSPAASRPAKSTVSVRLISRPGVHRAALKRPRSGDSPSGPAHLDHSKSSASDDRPRLPRVAPRVALHELNRAFRLCRRLDRSIRLAAARLTGRSDPAALMFSRGQSQKAVRPRFSRSSCLGLMLTCWFHQTSWTDAITIRPSQLF